jgi:subtilase family serine protease
VNRRPAIAAAAILISACAALIGGSSGTKVPTLTGRSGTAQFPLGGVIAASTDLGPADGDTSIEFLMTLRDDHAAEEAEAVSQLYDPRSPSFGKYLTASESQMFGPNASEVALLRDQLTGVGLTSEWRPGQAWLSATGRAADVEQVFGVALHRYRSRSGIEFTAPTGPPRVPDAWRGIVTGINDLADYPIARPLAVRAGGLTPDDLLQAYNIMPLRQLNLDGTGQTVVVALGPEGYRQEALNTFTTKPEFGLPPIDVGPVKIVDPLTLEVKTTELEMDLETIHSIAPGARLVVYVSKDWTTSLTELQSRAISENPGAIVSQSWGGCERKNGTATLKAWSDIYEEGAKHGVTVFVSSGDSGAYTCLGTGDEDTPTNDGIGASAPATIPWVTAVGGTRLSLRADGSYYRESVWSWPAYTEASGGGPSMHFPNPEWQCAPGVPAACHGAWRLTPDVAADAAPESGNAIFSTLYGWRTGGGTSLSAPIWAGMTALINQYLQKQGLQVVGAFNQALYAIANSTPQYPPFHDVVEGGNLVESAGPGWDSSTGLGTPDAYNLARDLEQYMRSGGQ